MSSNTVQFGLPLETPIKQTLIPVVEIINSTTLIHGYFPIAVTEFDGSETTVTIDGSPVAIQSITLPDGIEPTGGYHPHQYMAATYSFDDAKSRPWIGYPSWVGNDKIGFSSRWVMPNGQYDNNYVYGPLIGSLMISFDRYTTVAGGTPTPPPDPDVTDGSYTWYAELPNYSQRCSFFDFNWMDTLQAKPLPGMIPGSVIPLRIEVVSNPAGGEFKAAILTDQPAVFLGPNAQPMYNTIRVLRMVATAASGDYVFQFRVYQLIDGVETASDVEFTLTVL